jgi:hypothetical protein
VNQKNTMDVTIGDIYLVNSLDDCSTVYRPTLYTIQNTDTGMITHTSIKLKEPCREDAVMILNVNKYE